MGAKKKRLRMIRRIAEDMRRREAQRDEPVHLRKLTKKEKKRLRYERMWAGLMNKAVTTKADFLQSVTSAVRSAE